MTFLVANACAFWYYKSHDNSVLRGFNNIKYHLGSICFASIIVTLLTILKLLSSDNRDANGSFVSSIVESMFSCFSCCMEHIFKVLNHNSIIVMSVTGEGYISSAKSTLSLVFDNLSLFFGVDYFVNAIELFSLVFICLVPSIIGTVIVYQSEESTNSLAINHAVWVGIIILLISIFISSVIVGIIKQILSSIFIFYAFDKKFKSLGFQVDNLPQEI